MRIYKGFIEKISVRSLKTRLLTNKIYVKLLFLFMLILVAVGVYMFFFKSQPCGLEYNIKPITTGYKSIQVNLHVYNIAHHERLTFYIGGMKLTHLLFTDNNAREIAYDEEDGIITIHSTDIPELNIKYVIRLGEAGKHGRQGEYSDDLLAFNGEDVLLLPELAFGGTDKEIKDILKCIRINYEVPDQWKCIVPYPVNTKKDNDIGTYVDSLTWSKVYEIRKACYAFGNFEKKEFKKKNGGFTVYIDKAASQRFTEEESNGLNAIYDYYANLFGYDLEKFSILMLRKAAIDDSYLIAGSGSQTLGSTFDPNRKRDWELMAHRLFHAFFDSKVSTAYFHNAPQLWFYEGLATYYENVSVGYLPQTLKKRLDIDTDNNFCVLFKEYIYMKLKDRFINSIVPMNEVKLQVSEGMIEFLHYTEAPLIIKAIEDDSFKANKNHDIMLKYILKNYSASEFSLNDILYSALGSNGNDFAKKYFLDNGILPLWYLADDRTEEPDKVVASLNELEYTLWTWYRLEDSNYPIDKLTLVNLDKISRQALKEGIHFADGNVEIEVQKLSGTVYGLLRQYALRAKICGVDYNDPLMRFKILDDAENIDKWESYIRKISEE